MRKILIFGLVFGMILSAVGCVQPPLQREGTVLVSGKNSARPAETPGTAQYDEACEAPVTEADFTAGETDCAATDAETDCETTGREHTTMTAAPAAPTETTAPAGTTEEAKPAHGTVYWVAGGSVWHLTDRCSSLARSKQILSGTVEEAISAGKSRACKICSP